MSVQFELWSQSSVNATFFMEQGMYMLLSWDFLFDNFQSFIIVKH